jgi:integrase
LLPDNTQGRAIRFILGTGLRASELCSLRWSAIDKGAFTVRQSAQYVRNINAKKGEAKQRLSLAATKTKAGHRSIPLTDAMQRLLDQQRQAQMKKRLSIGAAWLGGQAGVGDTPVFATEVGTVYDKKQP